MEHKVVFFFPLMGMKAGFSLTFHTVPKKKLVIWFKFTSADEALLSVYREGMFDSSNAGGLVHRGNYR